LQAQLRKSLGVFVDTDAQQEGGAAEPGCVFALELPSLGRGRRGASASRLSENGGIDSPPVIGEIGAIRQTIVEQHSQFLSLERVERIVRVRPPPNSSPRKTAQAQPVASAVIGEEFGAVPERLRKTNITPESGSCNWFATAEAKNRPRVEEG
jgi:hypothetical protein